MVKRLLDAFQDQFRVGFCFLCFFAREFGKRLDLGQPTAAELASLLDDLDRRRPFLLPYVLELMAATPSADAVAARWRPPEKSQEEFIARKFFTFRRMVFKRLNRGDENSRRLMAELLDVFREHRISARESALDTGFFGLPLGTLLMIEQIIEDERLSIPGKVVAVNELVTGDGPVYH